MGDLLFDSLLNLYPVDIIIMFDGTFLLQLIIIFFSIVNMLYSLGVFLTDFLMALDGFFIVDDLFGLEALESLFQALHLMTEL